LAKIKLRIGKDEIEIDSRDFYVDNQTIGKVIEDIALHLHECGGRMLPNRQLKLTNREEIDTLSSLEDVEVYEPEFSEPVSVPLNELRGKLLVLSKSSFFDQPRTVSEIASELRKHGLNASLLDEAKTLARITFNKKLLKNEKDDRSCYFMKKSLLAN